MKELWRKWGSKVSPAAFGLVLICFALPFISLQCGGNVLATASGYDIVAGQAFGDVEGAEGKKDIEYDAIMSLVIVALFCAVLGIIIALFRGMAPTLLTAVFGSVGAVALLAFRWSLNWKIAVGMKPDEAASGDMFAGLGEAMAKAVSVDYRYGFWLAVLFLVAGVVTKIIWWREHE